MADFAKKLTVSFGAFSCTLSGFDDPFPVMSQVVDYFQKLSKTDPSFGAHPERPDTEALRALAEKTSGLTVGAELKGDEVVLSSLPDEIDAEIPTLKAAPAPQNTATEASQPVSEPNPTDASPVPEVQEENAPKSAESIDQIVAQAFDDCDVYDEVEEAGPTDLQPETAVIPEQINHTENEILETLNAEELYDIMEPVQDQVAGTETIEDISTYVSEAVVFDDIEDLNNEDLLVETPEAAQTPSQNAKFDPIPVWAAELISDEPLEEITENQVADIKQDQPEAIIEDEDLSYDDHIEAEQTALARILAASQDDNSAQADVSDDPTDALELDEDAAATARSLVLGFGAAASFDATHEVETSTVDARTPAPASEALAAMGVYEEDDEDFGWATQEAPQPEKASEATPVAAPLLLTPMQQIVPLEDGLEVIEKTAPSSAINMDQDDPRADLRRFADAAGAVSLTDLLEASAAYSTLVSGRPSFSRGEVLDLLDEFSDEEGFSQEARIKTFGSLLRGGRINRVNNGQYEMCGDALLEYQDARKAG